MKNTKRAASVLSLIILGLVLNGCTRAPSMGGSMSFGGGPGYTPSYGGYQSLPPFYYGTANNPAIGYQSGTTPVYASFDPRFSMGGAQTVPDNYVVARNDANYYGGNTSYPSYSRYPAPGYQTASVPAPVMIPGIQGYSSYPANSGIQTHAKDVASWAWFPYHRATQGGRLGGAQVVSTILQRAGALDRMHLDVAGLRRNLKRRGWCPVPQHTVQPGDVVVWRTSGSRRNVGVAVGHGGRICVVQNNSDMRRPILIPIEEYPYPAEEVLRRPAYA